MNAISEQLGAYGPLIINAIKALVFLVVGWFAAGGISSFIRTASSAANVSTIRSAASLHPLPNG